MVICVHHSLFGQLQLSIWVVPHLGEPPIVLGTVMSPVLFEAPPEDQREDLPGDVVLVARAGYLGPRTHSQKPSHVAEEIRNLRNIKAGQTVDC